MPDNIDISISPNGVVPLPSTAPTAFINDGFIKYTKIQCPNGEAIHFVAQSNLTDAQIIRARTILEWYLKPVPGSQYGYDKTNVINTMGTNDATLLLLNGFDGSSPEPNVWGQPLFEEEIQVEGHTWYQNNDYDQHRDASFEEILHLMHDMGIGVDGPNSISNPALPAFQTEIRAAQNNACLNNFAIWPVAASWDPGALFWYNELDSENSLSQEYLASVIDSYYGLWDAWTDEPNLGMYDLYISHNRDEIQSEDTMGWVLVQKYFAPYINVDMIIDPTFNGIFSLTFTTPTSYTSKSRYLQHCYLSGNNPSGLQGNNLYNRLKGNNENNTLEGMGGNDRLDGMGGYDTAIFSGNYSEYSITNNLDHAIVQDNTPNRDGVDTLWNINTIKFIDQDVSIILINTSILEEIVIDNKIKIYPNPTNKTVNICSQQEDQVVVLNITGEIVNKIELNKGINTIDVSSYTNGIYFVRTIDGITKKIIIQK